LEGKQLEGREKNFKQMFEGRRRNAEGLENSRENGVGRGNFGYIYIRRKRDKEEMDKISRYSCRLAQMVILYYIV